MPSFSLRAGLALFVLMLHAMLMAACGGSNDKPVGSSFEAAPVAPAADPVAVPDLPEPQPMPKPDPHSGPAPIPVPTPAPTPAPAPDPVPAPDPAPSADPVTLAGTLTPLVAGTAGSYRYFAAGGSGSGAPIAGVGCATSEHYHIHAMISFYREGIRLGIPEHIGLNGCTYEMHTHDPTTGVVHIETDVQKNFVLGQFFALWGQDLSRSSAAGIGGPVRFYTIENGILSLVTGEPALIPLTARREVLIITGTAPVTVPRYDWASTGL